MVFSLTDFYNQIINLILQSDPLPPFYQARSMLTLEEAGLAKKASTMRALVARETNDVASKPSHMIIIGTILKVGEIMEKIELTLIGKIAITVVVVARTPTVVVRPPAMMEVLAVRREASLQLGRGQHCLMHGLGAGAKALGPYLHLLIQLTLGPNHLLFS